MAEENTPVPQTVKKTFTDKVLVPVTLLSLGFALGVIVSNLKKKKA